MNCTKCVNGLFQLFSSVIPCPYCSEPEIVFKQARDLSALLNPDGFLETRLAPYSGNQVVIRSLVPRGATVIFRTRLKAVPFSSFWAWGGTSNGWLQPDPTNPRDWHARDDFPFAASPVEPPAPGYPEQYTLLDGLPVMEGG